jgi:hypothetical protein
MELVRSSQVFLDASPEPTRGQILSYSTTPFVEPSVSGTVVGPAPNVTVTTTAHRKLIIEAELVNGKNEKHRVSWAQDLQVRTVALFIGKFL